MSIKHKLAILFFTISFLPSVIIGILTYNNYEKLFERDELQRLEYIADYKLNEINMYFSGLIDDAKSMQSSWCIKENLPVIIEFSEDPSNPKFVSAKKILDERFQPTQNTWGLLDIIMTDMDGRVVYVTNSDHHRHLLKPMPDPDARSFREGLKGVYVTDIFKDPADNGKLRLFISVPSFTSDGLPIGVIIFEVDLDRIYTLIQDFTGLGNTGETLIAMKLNHDALYLNPLRHDPNAAFARRVEIGSISGIPIQRAVTGNKGCGHSIDYRGIKVLAAWRYLPTLRWGLVTKIDTAEAFKDCYVLRVVLFITMGILFIICVLISRMIAGFISKYRDHLESAVNERTSQISQLNRNVEFILGATKTGLDIIDSDFNIVYIDPEWKKVYGDPKGKKCYEYFMEKDEACRVCGVKEAIETKKPVVSEEILVKEGNRPMQVTTIPYQDEKGNWFVAEVNVDISERKKIEAELIKYREHLETLLEEKTNELRKSEEKYRIVSENAYDLETWQSPDGQFIYISPSCKKITGYTVEDFITDTSLYEKIIFQDDRVAFAHHRNKAIQEKSKGELEFRIVRADGKLRWIGHVCVPVFDNKGCYLGIRGSNSDITERKAAEEAQIQRQAELYGILETTTNGILAVNTHGKVLHINKRFLEMWNIPAGMLDPTDDKTLLNYVMHQLSEPDLFIDKVKHIYALTDKYEDILNFKDGRIFQRHSTPFTINGSLVGRVWSFRDITEERKLIDEIKRYGDEWQKTFDGSKDMISLLDRDMKIVKANLSLVNFVGQPMSRIIGAKCHKITHGTDEPIPECPVIIALQSKHHETTETFLVDKNIWISISADPILNKDGEVESIVHTIRDITEREIAEAALEISEANYRAIFDLASDAIIVRDIESYAIVDANEQACELLCYPKDELLKLSPEILFLDEPPNNWKYIKPIFDKAAAGEPQSIEMLLKDKAQRTFWVESHIKRAIIGGAYRLLSIAHDISERKDSERQIIDLNNSIAKANEELKNLALLDSHTGLYNYHYYSGVIESEFARAQRQDSRLSLIMMDIDYFKSINDVYGHQFGDLILKQFAEVLKKTVRLYDTVIRFGGEEFIIVAPGTGNEEVTKLAKRILSAVESFPFGDDTHKVKIKVSAASGSYPDDPRIKSSVDFINIADSILSKAKEEGGNRAYSSLNYAPNEHMKLKSQEPDVASLKDKIGKLTARGNQSVAEAILAFAKTIELKDRYTGAHVDDTMHYAVLISEKLGLGDRETEIIKYAAALHDLGKVGIPEAILQKNGKLTEEEFNIIKLHPQIGVDIIRPIQFLHDIIPAMLHHHERWDGSGYPTGLRKESIPLGSRIVAVADAYQAMISDRPYRKAIGQTEAIA